MEPRGAPKTGRLFLKTHGDCFLHATASWLKYWNFSLEDRVAIVRVTLSNEWSFLTTLSPISIPYDMVRKGMPRDRYLEIDTRFGRKLGILPDTEVAVDPVRDIEHCTSLHLVPENPSDYEKLEDYSDKVDFELMDKIRVVSAQSFCFPIWVVDNLVVPVKVVRCEPREKWVLLVSGKTVVHIEKDTWSTDTGTGSLPERSSTGGTEPSEESEDQIAPKSPATWDFNRALVDKAHKLPTCPGSTTGGSSGYSSQAASPDSELDTASVASGFLASLLDTTQNFISRNIPLPSLLSRPDNVSEEEPVKPPADPPDPPTMPSKGSTRSTQSDEHLPDGVSIVESNVKPQPRHRRYNTWHSESDFRSGRALRVLPNYIGTPKMRVYLRVQPHSIHQIGKRTSLGPQRYWNHESVLDVFVHPSSIPEVFHYVQHSPSALLLVELQPVEPPYTPRPPEEHPAPEPKPSTAGEEDPLSDIGEFGKIADMDPFSKAPERSSKTPERSSKTQDQSSKTQDQSSKPQDQSSKTQDQSSKTQDQSSKPPERSSYKPFLDSVIVRLCFATKIICRDDGIVPEKSEDTSLSETATTPVKVGHIMMSDVVRQQLKIEQCSLVQLLHVKDEWRANPGFTSYMVRLYPIGRKEPIKPEILTAAFEEWVKQVFATNKLGVALVLKQLIPMKTASGEWINCKVAFRTSRLLRDENPRIQFCMVKPSDIQTKQVKLSVDQRSRGPALADLTKLNLPVFTKTREEFGALEKLEEAGLQYLRSVFSEPNRSGSLLICGLGSSSGAGCGKSSLAKLLCKSVSQPPYCAHVSILDCTTMRGQNSPHRLKKRITQIFAHAMWCQPSVLLLEKLDHGMPHMGDAQEAAVNVDAINGVKRAQVFLDCMSEVRRTGAQVVIIATAQSKQQLQKDLLQSRGKHIFEKVLEIAPPSLDDRKAILRAIMYSKNLRVLSDEDLRDIALKTEGFQARDLVTLTDRAVSHSQLRPLQPIRFINHPMRFSLSSQSSTSLSSSPKKHLTFKPGTSPQTQPQKKFSIISNASTLISFPTAAEGRSQPRLEDFKKALKGFVPLSLQGLSLHSSGSVDFSNVGGLMQAKQTLKETLLWPSKETTVSCSVLDHEHLHHFSLAPTCLASPLQLLRNNQGVLRPSSLYPRLFSQCTIKQRCGLLLYGAPGTGKTLLAGAVAKEFGMNFVSIKGPELLSKYIGASELAVRDIFTRAQSAKPCILFFDEFDSLAPRRGHDRTGVTDRVVNQLLTQLDGVEALQGVYVLAASSRPDLIDPALLRPGRIDHSLFCDIPNQDARLEILEALSREMPFDEEVDLEEIAEKTNGFTGADLKAVLYNAQLQAAHAALDSEAEYSHQSVQTSEEKLKREKISGGGEVRKLVFSFSSSGLNKKYHTVDEQATRPEKLKEHSVVWGQPFQSHRRAEITQAQLLNVLQDVKPSVSDQEKKKYSEIYERYAGKTKTRLTSMTQQIATMA